MCISTKNTCVYHKQDLLYQYTIIFSSCIYQSLFSHVQIGYIFLSQLALQLLYEQILLTIIIYLCCRNVPQLLAFKHENANNELKIKNISKNFFVGADQSRTVGIQHIQVGIQCCSHFSNAFLGNMVNVGLLAMLQMSCIHIYY